MASFVVEIELDNAAFEDSGELSRILRSLADRVEVQVVDEQIVHNGGLVVQPLGGWTCRDVNGNPVGEAWIEGSGV